MAKTQARHLDRIVVDPEILVGKPVVRGTRIPIYIVLQHLAHDLDLGTLSEDYPRLSPDDVKACLAYAAAVVAGEDVFLCSSLKRLPPIDDEVSHR